MTDPEYGSIERELRIDARPEVVYEVLTSPRYIREWWDAETDADMSSATTGSLTWTDESTGTSQSEHFTVVDADPPRTFSFTWVADEAARSLLVTFTLDADGAGTRLRLVESGFREHGWDAVTVEATYRDHVRGWDTCLANLAETAERVAAP